jgi:hypothetical protein
VDGGSLAGREAPTIRSDGRSDGRFVFSQQVLEASLRPARARTLLLVVPAFTTPRFSAGAGARARL